MPELENNDSPQSTTNNTAETAELTLSDLGSIKNILEVATQRGAFKANELSAVGQIYDKLNTFLTSITKIADSNKK